MPLGFYVTDKGRRLIDNAIATERKVVITKACFGDGGDAEAPTNYAIEDLVHTFYEKELDEKTDSYGVDPNDPTSLYIKSVLPSEVTGTINEVGYKDIDGNLIIYGLPRPRTKRGGLQGEGDLFVYQNWVRLENGDVDKIEINVLSPQYEELINQMKTMVSKDTLLVATDEDIQEFLGV